MLYLNVLVYSRVLCLLETFCSSLHTTQKSILILSWFLFLTFKVLLRYLFYTLTNLVSSILIEFHVASKGTFKVKIMFVGELVKQRDVWCSNMFLSCFPFIFLWILSLYFGKLFLECNLVLHAMVHGFQNKMLSHLRFFSKPRNLQALFFNFWFLFFWKFYIRFCLCFK